MTLGTGIAIAGMWLSVAAATVAMEWINHGTKEGLSPAGVLLAFVIAGVTTYYVSVGK